MDIMLVVIAALQAYVLGSINFAVIFTNLFKQKEYPSVSSIGMLSAFSKQCLYKDNY